MSKSEILAELPKLGATVERDLLNGGATPEEKALLDRELEEYKRNPEAGSSWTEVETRIRKSSRP